MKIIEFDRSTSQVRARVKFESRVKVESSQSFLFDVFGSFVFNCCVKIMHQKNKNSKI